MTPKDTPHTATQGASERSEPLAVSSMSRDVRAALMFALWHHQGGSSPTGQPIRAMFGIGQHDHMSDHAVAEAKRVAAALAQRQPATTDPQAPPQEAARCSDGGECGAGGYCEACPARASQEAREFHGEDGYPPMPEPAMEEVPYELWGQNSTYPALYTDAQMRSYVDSDRKARQQQAQTLLDAMQANPRWQLDCEVLKFGKPGKWRVWKLRGNPMRSTDIKVLGEGDTPHEAIRAALAKGPSHE